MRKDIIIGIIFGVSFGLLIAFGFWRVNSAYKLKENTNAGVSENTPQKTDNSGNFSISIASPQNYDVITENPVKISGITQEYSKIIISSEEKDYILEAGSDGSFEQDIELVGGTNQILISAFDNQGNKTEKTLLLVFSTEFSN